MRKMKNEWEIWKRWNIEGQRLYDVGCMDPLHNPKLCSDHVTLYDLGDKNC